MNTKEPLTNSKKENKEDNQKSDSPIVKAILNDSARSVTKMTEDCHRETERLSPLDRAHTDN